MPPFSIRMDNLAGNLCLFDFDWHRKVRSGISLLLIKF